MSNLLLSHKLDQIPVILIQPRVFKLLSGESLQAVAEQVELDPFLIKRQVNRLIIKVTLDGVNRFRRAHTSFWRGKLAVIVAAVADARSVVSKQRGGAN